MGRDEQVDGNDANLEKLRGNDEQRWEETNKWMGMMKKDEI